MRSNPTAVAGATSFLWFVNGGAATSTALSLSGGANGSSTISIDATVTAVVGTPGVGQITGPLTMSAEL